MNEMDKLAILTFVYIIEEYLERIRKAKEEINCCYEHILVNISDLKTYLCDTNPLHVTQSCIKSYNQD